MAKVLISAFEPYDRWTTNASWQALVELTRNLPETPHVVTRRYPVNYDALKKRLAHDLQANYDFAIFLGQAPGSSALRLEAIGLNLATNEHSASSETGAETLVAEGPVAYRSALPLERWASILREAGIPAQVSYHAGTYLCNAALYLGHHYATQRKLKTQIAFIHVPLDPTQAAGVREAIPSLPASISAEAIRIVLGALDHDAQQNRLA